MKRIGLLGGIIVLGLLVCGGALANTSPVRAAGEVVDRTITVTGDADVKVVPDEASMILGVETMERDLNTAKNQNDERIKKILAATRDLGIDPKYVQTDQMSIEPRYSDSYTKRDFVGFFIRKSIVITLKDVTKFEAATTAVLNAGVTNVYNVQYRTTELRKYRDQARNLALVAAKEKATAMAGALGQKVGKPRSIREEYSNVWSWYSWRWGGGSMAQNVVQNAGGSAPAPDDGSVALGQITINARVSVVFDLE